MKQLDDLLTKLSGAKDAIGGVLSKLGASTITYESPPGEYQRLAKEAQDADTAAFYSGSMKEASPYIKRASERYGVPQHLLASIYAQESSSGNADKHYNKDIGESAWLLGLTKKAKADLEKAGHKVDLDSKQGVFDAAAAYLSLRGKEYTYDPKTNEKAVSKDYTTNPQEWYLSRYADPAKRDMIKESFGKRLSYYEQYIK